jgi:hypothetical protein
LDETKNNKNITEEMPKAPLGLANLSPVITSVIHGYEERKR